MTGDEIVLTLPARRPYYGVAHLVMGGLAVRLNLTFESLEDIQLALDGLLEQDGLNGEVTIVVRVTEEALELRVGPFETAAIEAALRADDDVEDLGLRRLLDTVVDRVEIGSEDAGWVVLSKSMGSVAAKGA
jgi:hypothetical protein